MYYYKFFLLIDLMISSKESFQYFWSVSRNLRVLSQSSAENLGLFASVKKSFDSIGITSADESKRCSFSPINPISFEKSYQLIMPLSLQ